MSYCIDNNRKLEQNLQQIQGVRMFAGGYLIFVLITLIVFNLVVSTVVHEYHAVALVCVEEITTRPLPTIVSQAIYDRRQLRIFL
jgi:hypothetical protein